jgi:5,10-methenyltetrahydrofolate synthetase
MSVEVDSDSQFSKEAWQKKLRPLRTKVDSAIEIIIINHLVQLLDQVDGPILFYRAMAEEIRLDGLAERLGWERFATTRTPGQGPLTVHRADGIMEQHKFGFIQPLVDAENFPLGSISVALIPALAIDIQGNRLGHGAGYYDELLSRLPDHCLRVGVVTEQFIFDHLPCESHDVPMTHLASEVGVRSVKL